MIQAGETNSNIREAKTTHFRPGDIISFFSQTFRVITNHGEYGHVESWPDRQRTFKYFRWTFNKHHAKLIGHVPFAVNQH